MLRLVAAFVALTLSVPAFACGGGKCSEECGKAHAAAPAPAKVEGTKVVLNVTGMTCASCANRITTALLAVEGVKTASVDHTTGRAEIIIDDKKTNADALVKVVTDLSYKASLAES